MEMSKIITEVVLGVAVIAAGFIGLHFVVGLIIGMMFRL